MWDLKTMRPHLFYEKFIARTDHAALHWLLTIYDRSGRLMRWRLRLAQFDLEVQYKNGRKNRQVDALLRLFTYIVTTLDAISLGRQPESMDDLDYKGELT